MRAHLADVMPSVLASIGAPLADLPARINLEESQSAVVVLVDGLGIELLDARRDVAPMLAGQPRHDLTAGFPTTTPAGLGSLGTGLRAGDHGMVAASFWIPECDRMLHPLRWGGDPPAYVVAPESSVFDRAAAAGVSVHAVSPRAYADSGLTRSVLHGAHYLGADSVGERIAETVHAAQVPRSLTYVYWGELDRTGHVHGWQSEHWSQELRTVEMFLERLRAAIPRSTRIYVTADHGMVDCEVRVDVDSPELRADVLHLGGEPRCRHLYVRAGAAGDVAARWAEELGDRARVLQREEVVRTMYGGADAYADRIGDVVAIANGAVGLVSDRTDQLVSSLVGQHGSDSGAEEHIGLLVLS